MHSTEVRLTGIYDWDFDPPDWWTEAWYYDDPIEFDTRDHAQVDPKIEELLSQEMPF